MYYYHKYAIISKISKLKGGDVPDNLFAYLVVAKSIREVPRWQVPLVKPPRRWTLLQIPPNCKIESLARMRCRRAWLGVWHIKLAYSNQIFWIPVYVWGGFYWVEWGIDTYVKLPKSN